MSLRAEAEAILHDRSKVIDAEREQLRRFAEAYLELEDRTFARVKYSSFAKQEEFESNLLEIQPDMDFDRISCDEYDNSIEFYEVPNGVRLTHEALVFVKAEGFSLCWLNHQDGWETLYNLHKDNKCGWRKRQWKRRLSDGSLDPSGLIELEERCDTWPSAWYESGYVTIVDAKSESLDSPTAELPHRGCLPNPSRS